MDEIGELVIDQCEIIKKQAGLIDRLFLLLLQHIQIEDMEAELQEMQAVTKIAAKWEP